MVSKLEILSRYYQIYIDDIEDGYFVYNNQLYYLSDTIPSNEQNEQYQMYMLNMQVHGYYIVRSCFGHIETEGYVLYSYEPEEYSINAILEQSFQIIPNEYGSLKVIKDSWCRIIDDVRNRVAKHASRINHNEYYVILTYYYLGLAENVINIISETLLRFPKENLPLGYEHLIFEDTYDT
ncbi:MAG: hypothetical protein ACK5LC_15770, partial [Coprobacillaceae bacterium]